MSDSILSFLEDLRQRDIKISLSQDQLVINAPQGVLTPSLTAQLRSRKKEILEFLRENRVSFPGPPIETVSRASPLPLSSAQKQLWFLHYMGVKEAYNIPARLRLRGVLSPALLEQALNELVCRHESLRTNYVEVAGEVRQVIAAGSRLRLTAFDLSGLPSEQRIAEYEERVMQAACQPFALDAELMLRATLFKLQESEHVLLLTVHHIAVDGCSIGILLREMAELYGAFARANPSPLPPLALQYADFACWSNAASQVEQRQQHVEYFKGQLLSAPPLLELPTDRKRPSVQSHRGAKHTFVIAASLTQALRQRARQQGVTLFVTLLAGFKLLLARYSGRHDILVDTPVLGRNRSELEPLVGLFVNSLILRTDLSGSATFAELTSRVQRTVQQAFANQEAPFEQVVSAVAPERTLSYGPITQVSFSLQPAFKAHAMSPELVLDPAELLYYRARTDLELFVFESEDDLACEYVYSTDLFDPDTVHRLARHYLAVLSQAVEDPHQPLAALSLLDAAERQQILVEWNDTARSYPRDRFIFELIAEQAQRTPTAPAVIAAALPSSSGALRAGPILTYQELDERANQLAHYLGSLGIPPGSRIAILAARSPEVIVAFLAILKAGCCYVPLDASYPKERLDFMVMDARPAALLVGNTLADPYIPGAVSPIIYLSQDLPMVATQPIHAPPLSLLPEDPAYVVYTSGTTGQSKGVVASHRALLNEAWAMRKELGLSAADAMLQFADLSFDVAAEEIFTTLLSGGVLVLPPPQQVLPLSELLALVEQHRLTALSLPVSYFHEWVRVLHQHPVPTCIRLIITGAETVLAPRLAAWFEYFQQQDRPAPVFYNAYGLSETTITNTLYRAQASLPPGAQSVPVGRPIANIRIYILDPDGNPTPIGVPGELYVGGECLALGYLNQPALTRERFIHRMLPMAQSGGSPNGAGTGAEQSPPQPAPQRLYRTGDRARYLADGNIEHLGRMDSQVKIRGLRVELGAVAAALREHPQLRDAAVVDQADPSGARSLVAFAIPNSPASQEEAPLSESVLRQFLQTRLPEYMIPRAIHLVTELPHLPNGKLDLRALSALRPLDTVPAPRNSARATDSLLDRVTAIYCAVLERKTVGLDDNFFDLGGHSLLLVRLHSQLQTQLGCTLAVTELFQFPTVRSLCSRLGQTVLPLLPEAATQAAPPRSTAIAIIGMVCRFPGADTLDAFWQNLCAGRESLSLLSDDQLRQAGVAQELIDHPGYVKRRGTLADIDQFAAAFFGYSPKEAALTDPQHRIFLECAWHALEQAGYPPLSHDGRVGVFAGCGHNSYQEHVLSAAADAAANYQTAISNEAHGMPTHVSYKLNLTGPSVAVNTACSTGLVAVHLAGQSLLANECDLALAGAVSISAEQNEGYLYQEGMVLSPDGRCRAFDARAAGTALGSGAGIIVLKRLQDAQAAGDHIYAVMLGSAINNDGARKVGYTAPSVQGQARVIVDAQARAGVSAASLGYVEAHGTGTPLGDPIEVAALAQAFRHSTDQKGFCAIGSVKTNLGHLDTAAGMAGIIKTALALQHRQLPPSLHFEEPNPQIDFTDSPFYVNTQLRPWPKSKHAPDAPLRAGVSSFGIGGTNAHVILEEPPSRASSPLPAKTAREAERRDGCLLLLSAREPADLEAISQNLAAYLERHPQADLADVAYTLGVGRAASAHRRALFCRDHADALRALSERNRHRNHLLSHPAERRAVVYLFPGQGSQFVGMGQDLYRCEPRFRSEVDRCCELLMPHLGLDLRTVLYPKDLQPADPAREDLASAPASALALIDQTAYTQPALFVIEYALARLCESFDVGGSGGPQLMLGHSVGEYVAATLAGVFSLPDALALVAARGRMMQAMPAGAMLSVRLAAGAVQGLLGPELSLAAENGEDSCVLSGMHAAVAAAERHLSEKGIASRRLRTSHAYHSSMMDPIVAPFADEVRKIKLHPPQRPYLSSATGALVTAAQATDPLFWAQQLRQPVRFFSAATQLLKETSGVLLEVGPGRALASFLNRHPARSKEQSVLSLLPSERPALTQDQGALAVLAELWLRGVTIDWQSVYADAQRHRLPLPTYPLPRQRCWIDRKSSAQPPSASPNHASKEPDPPHRKPEIEDWFYTPVWQHAPLRRSVRAATSGDPVLLFLDGLGLGSRLATRLKQGGGPVITVEQGATFSELGEGRYALDPANAEGYAALVAALEQRGHRPTRIVHLWSVTTANAVYDWTTVEREQDLGFYSLLYLSQALQHRASSAPCEVLIVSNEMESVAAESRQFPGKATLLGWVKVASQEFTALRGKSVDIVLPPAPRGERVQGSWQHERLITQLCEELAEGESALAGTDPSRIAYRGDQRFMRGYTPVVLPKSPRGLPLLRQGGTYLISGGLGGIGLHIAAHLAKQVQARLVLIGRSHLPERQDWDAWLARTGGQDRIGRILLRLRELEKDGAQLLLAKADVTDSAQVSAVVQTARARFGSIHGVVHAAGLPGQGLILHKTRHAAAQVLEPKLQGTWALFDALQDTPPDWVLLCSSLTAILGGAGQLEYCAANNFLDAFAHFASECYGVRTFAVNWDTWRQSGMAVDWLLRSRRSAGRQSLLPWLPIGPIEKPDAALESPTPFTHPLLERPRRDAAGHAIYVSRLDPATHWVLGEHRLLGQATLPATAYLELARAAFCAHTGHRAVELGEVVLLQPLSVEDTEQVEVQTCLGRTSAGWRFVILSRGATGETIEHARGEVGPLPEAVSLDSTWPAFPDRLATPHDLKQASGVGSPSITEDVIQVGRRWQVLTQSETSGEQGAARLCLPPEYAEDLKDYWLHPGLLDAATNFMTANLGALYLPFQYKRLRMHRPLAPSIRSQMRVEAEDQPTPDTRTFAVRIHDENGHLLVEIEGYTLRRMAPPAAVLSHGLSDEEGLDVFERILAQDHTQILVSTRDLQEERDRAAVPVAPVTPRDDIERQVAEVFARALGLPHIGTDEDFLQLGGDSLLAVQMSGQLTAILGRRVAPAQLLSTPTVASLIAALAPRTPLLDARGPADPARPLVLLKDGEPGRRPVFLIHPVGGSVYCYRELVRGLVTQRPIYAIQSPGLEGESEPLSQVSAMAAHYLRMIRQVQPVGPYSLGGWSLGGLIGLEIAQQLHGEGESARLAMIDTFFPEPPLAPRSDAEYAVNYARYIGDVVGKEFVLDTSALVPMTSAERVAYIVAEGRKLDVLPEALSAQEIAQRLAVYTANFAAMDNYSPRPYRGDVLFCAARQSLDLVGAPCLSWGEILRGPLRQQEVPGNHYTILASPDLLASMQQFLDE